MSHDSWMVDCTVRYFHGQDHRIPGLGAYGCVAVIRCDMQSVQITVNPRNNQWKGKKLVEIRRHKTIMGQNFKSGTYQLLVPVPFRVSFPEGNG